MLHSIKQSGTILDSQKSQFLKLLTTHSNNFKAFYNNQIELFKNVCAYYLEGLSDEEIKALYQSIPTDTFTLNKTDYLSLVDSKTKEFRNSLGNEQLKKLWKDKTDSISPQQWSKDHLMPILSLVPDSEVQTARAAFEAVNKRHPDASSIKKAIAYLKKASFYSLLNNQEELDLIFRDRILKSYSVMLTDIKEVKLLLKDRINVEPFDWFGLPEVDKRIQQMAEDKYTQEGCSKALEIIERMDVDYLKHYLKELIKNNMIVGMEIIREN